MVSPQTLSEADRRLVAHWAADCAEHVLPIFEGVAPDDARPRELLARARAFAAGELGAAEAIKQRFTGGVPVSEVSHPAASAAARAAGQAAAIAHMGAHALGAAAYAAKAADLAAPDDPAALDTEIAWQLDHATHAVKDALRQLPLLGENTAGPLGPGLLSKGLVGEAVRALQAGLSGSA